MNFAPVLDATPSPTLTGIAEDVTSADNTGTNVSSLVTGAITDQDGTAVSAIAVTAVDNTNGAWQYSTDNGANWNAFGTVTEATSRLLDGTLTGNDTQKIRFVPTLNYNGSATITFRAWENRPAPPAHGEYFDRQRRHDSLLHGDGHRLDHHLRRQRQASSDHADRDQPDRHVRHRRLHHQSDRHAQRHRCRRHDADLRHHRRDHRRRNGGLHHLRRVEDRHLRHPAPAEHDRRLRLCPPTPAPSTR